LISGYCTFVSDIWSLGAIESRKWLLILVLMLSTELWLTQHVEVADKRGT